MAKGKQYSLAVPHLPILYKVLSEFRAVHEEVKRLHALLHGDWMTRDVISPSARDVLPEDPLFPFLCTCMAIIANVVCNDFSGSKIGLYLALPF